jgi:tight adherence protein B
MIQMISLIMIILIVAVAAITVRLKFKRPRKLGARGAGKGLRKNINQYRVRNLELVDDADDDKDSSADSESESNEEEEEEYTHGKGLTLEMKLKYANLAWMPPFMVSILQIFVSLFFFWLAYSYLRTVMQIVSIFTGPILVNGWINKRMKKRTHKFDKDFAQFLLSVVGMLKTGLNTVQSLQAASESLDDDSLVKTEVELMIERVSLGVPEEDSIGAFGEDINQPEIELFVQALILSRRLGGTLSDTLDRLSKQVRKRQAFNREASSAVSQQSGSIWVIIGIIGAVQLYMYFMAPKMVIGAWTDPKLAGIAQSTIVIVLFALLMMKKVTNLKV